MKILAIESSCDETAAAVVEGRGEKLTVLSNVVASQIEIHKKYGGVVPEVAAREHVLNILPVINEALLKAKQQATNNLSAQAGKQQKPDIDVIAVTAGPGLITSLMVGVETARSLAYAWDIPLVAVNHIEGHIYSNWLPPVGEISNDQFPISNLGVATRQIKFPAVILTVSGGHNLLVLMKDHLKYKVIGDTRDDAAGEAFDKAAKLLGLSYPGGPAIAKKADEHIENVKNFQFPISNFQTISKSQFQNSHSCLNLRSHLGHSDFDLDLTFDIGNLKLPVLPRPMMNSGDFDFSFSGLKTALLYALQKDKAWKKRVPAYAAEFQQAVIDVLISKTVKAAKKFDAKTVLLSGGVSANSELRRQFIEAFETKLPATGYKLTANSYTTDNAAMIAAAGYFKACAERSRSTRLRVDPNLGI